MLFYFVLYNDLLCGLYGADLDVTAFDFLFKNHGHHIFRTKEQNDLPARYQHSVQCIADGMGGS